MDVNELRSELARDLARARARTRTIFAAVAPEAYLARPIPLRHPIVFYDGHLDAFAVGILRKALGMPPLDAELDELFERGIDPADEAAAAERSIAAWPPRAAIERYRENAAAYLARALATAGLSTSSDPLVRDGALFRLLLEHELMHQETLVYILHQLPMTQKRRPAGIPEPDRTAAPPRREIAIAAGVTHLGLGAGATADFVWDNERPGWTAQVPAFAIDSRPVTNGEFLEFLGEGGYGRRELWSDAAWAWRAEPRPGAAEGLVHPFFWRRGSNRAWIWRGLFGEEPLPASWPVFVTHAEASAYARWRGAALPSEEQWHRAAYGDDPQRSYPWGEAAPSAAQGNFDFALWSPTRAGAYPAGGTPDGVLDLCGNGWEWTATAFAPFPGFRPEPVYPGYSADFFDGHHYVLKGGSCLTDTRLLRRSFRNWFFWHYPYAYTGFRCVTPPR